jgi:hypothetical protein
LVQEWAAHRDRQVGRYSAVGGGGDEAGVCQLSGTKVMPDLSGVGAIFCEKGGTTVMAWHLGQEICRPRY